MWNTGFTLTVLLLVLSVACLLVSLVAIPMMRIFAQADEIKRLTATKSAQDKTIADTKAELTTIEQVLEDRAKLFESMKTELQIMHKELDNRTALFTDLKTGQATIIELLRKLEKSPAPPEPSKSKLGED